MEDELYGLLAAAVADLDLGLEMVDMETRAGTIRVVVDAPGGVGLEAISAATRRVSEVLDEHDPLPGQHYTLEVSSPGVERSLRRPDHFMRAVGETVSVRTAAGSAGERRFTGTLQAADDDGFVLTGDAFGDEGRRFAYDEIERARTVFEWGATTRPGRNGAAAARGGGRSRPGTDREKVTTP
ncbi:MAG TPA: ribosome maturation factor RimP [Acidimicrobiales bacterium]|nr:ribosome maturation factor RimP [Acidimicrobiales bacterium]